jgi:hypothetical protein
VDKRGLIAVAAGFLSTLTGCENRPEPPTPEFNAVLRVDQVGFLPAERKIAMLLTSSPTTGASTSTSASASAAASATVVDGRGRTILTIPVGSNRGAWNDRFSEVHPVDFSQLTKPGSYRIRVRGDVNADSPVFRVAEGKTLFGPLVSDSVSYFQAHRDGANQVSRSWRRQAAHLADRTASVYANPSFDENGAMTGDLERVSGGPVDVEGGWYDAGDYLKFTHTTAYALIALLIVRRDSAAPAELATEIRHGLDWLDKMWDESTLTLYTQVGIGSGLDPDDADTGDTDSDTGGFLGDHDTWRLPQTDDTLDVQPGDSRYYQRYRPVFRAADPGERLSPNLAGRVAAAFALGAQVEAGTDPARARHYLATAAQVFGLARTENVGDLVTAQPVNFYPEHTWTDDLAAAAAELALAGQALGDSRAAGWARQAAHWAAVNTRDGGTAALSVYDLSVLADAETARVLAAFPLKNPEIDLNRLALDLRTRLDAAVKAAAADPMGAAGGLGGSDYAARHLGYAITANLYQNLTGDDRYHAFGTSQRGIALGANGWGTSLVVGAGTTYPRCPHDQIASLTTGKGVPKMVGAVVNGPNRAEHVDELLGLAESGSCAGDSFEAYDRTDFRYTDSTRVSATSEPSIDFTATGMLAFALATRPARA